jgi:hypothetical protein
VQQSSLPGQPQPRCLIRPADQPHETSQLRRKPLLQPPGFLYGLWSEPPLCPFAARALRLGKQGAEVLRSFGAGGGCRRAEGNHSEGAQFPLAFHSPRVFLLLCSSIFDNVRPTSLDLRRIAYYSAPFSGNAVEIAQLVRRQLQLVPAMSAGGLGVSQVAVAKLVMSDEAPPVLCACLLSFALMMWSREEVTWSLLRGLRSASSRCLNWRK